MIYPVFRVRTQALSPHGQTANDLLHWLQTVAVCKGKSTGSCRVNASLYHKTSCQSGNGLRYILVSNLCLCICLPSQPIDTIYLTRHPLQPSLIYVICSYPELPMGDSQNRDTPNHHWFPWFETNWMNLDDVGASKHKEQNTWTNTCFQNKQCRAGFSHQQP